MGKQKAGALTENRNSSFQNGFHLRVPPPPFPAAVFSGRSYVFLLTGSKNNGCNVIAWFNLLCMIHFLLWKSFYPLSAPQAEYTPYRFTNLIYFQKNIDPKSIQMPYQPRQNSKGQWRSPQKNNICHHEKFRITTATEHSLCQNAVHRLKNNNKCDGVHKLTGNLCLFPFTMAPMAIPIQQIWYIFTNWLARAVAESEVSPSFPTMTVSVILTPMVIML